MAHRTTSGSPAAASVDAPWLVSQVMWSNVVQYVSKGGIRIRELHGRARTTRDSLAGAPPRTCGDHLRVSLRSAGGHGSAWTTSTPFERPCKQWWVISTWSCPSISPSPIRPRMGRPTSRGAGSLPHPLPMWVECCLSICPYFSPRCFSPSPSTSSAMRRYRSRSAPTTCPAPSWGDTDVRKSSQIRPPAGESRCDSLPRAKRLRTSTDAYWEAPKFTGGRSSGRAPSTPSVSPSSDWWAIGSS